MCSLSIVCHVTNLALRWHCTRLVLREGMLGPWLLGHRAGNVLSGAGDRCNERAISARAAVM